MKSIEELEIEIKEIQEHNRRVELDKAWGIGRTRKIIISIFT